MRGREIDQHVLTVSALGYRTVIRICTIDVLAEQETPVLTVTLAARLLMASYPDLVSCLLYLSCITCTEYEILFGISSLLQRWFDLAETLPLVAEEA